MNDDLVIRFPAGFGQAGCLLAEFFMRFQIERFALVQFREATIFSATAIALQQVPDAEVKDHVDQRGRE